MKKNEVFSIITNQTRNAIIKRLIDIKKAVYTDLLYTVDHIQPLQSTGNLNYHLNFLLENNVIIKEDSIYKLSDKGKEIARFVTDIDHKWKEITKVIRGDTLSVYNLAEQFEEDTGHKMSKDLNEFMGSKMIMNETRIFGILADLDEIVLKEDYIELQIEELGITKLNYKKESGASKTFAVLKHPKIDYFISPRYFGLIQDFGERNFGTVKLFAQKENAAPFIIKVENKLKKSFFVLAPSSIDPVEVPKKK